ncbi:MAG: hypothetical protein SFT93_01975 [Rickettsiaceae bacterium]|nr:hypothetical protein [Rickettsiaceae bacterium]
MPTGPQNPDPQKKEKTILGFDKTHVSYIGLAIFVGGVIFSIPTLGYVIPLTLIGAFAASRPKDVAKFFRTLFRVDEGKSLAKAQDLVRERKIFGIPEDRYVLLGGVAALTIAAVSFAFGGIPSAAIAVGAVMSLKSEEIVESPKYLKSAMTNLIPSFTKQVENISRSLEDLPGPGSTNLTRANTRKRAEKDRVADTPTQGQERK